MARGWDSKSVEEQIESARERQGMGKPIRDVEQMANDRQRDSLLLQRTRVMRDLEACSSDRYRKTLSDGLSYLEGQLTALGWQR